MGKYATAFTNVGLIGVAKELVKRITTLEGLSAQAGAGILRVCSEFPEEFSALSERVTEAIR